MGRCRPTPVATMREPIQKLMEWRQSANRDLFEDSDISLRIAPPAAAVVCGRIGSPAHTQLRLSTITSNPVPVHYQHCRNPMARSDISTTVVPFQAGDGFACNLLHIKGPNPPTKGPVVLVHGAGVRANLLRPTTDVTLPEMLIDEGYADWLENWRASIDLLPNHWTLDQAAVFDHPYASQKIVEQTGSDEVKAVIHCQGSTSFMMSAVAGLVPQVKPIVSNAVALHPI